MDDIKQAIEKRISSNKDERLCIENLVALELDNYSVLEIASFYSENYELDLRNFLESRISQMFISRKDGERLNTH